MVMPDMLICMIAPLYTWEWVVGVLVSVYGRKREVGGEKWAIENWLDAELQSLACAGLLNEF